MTYREEIIGDATLYLGDAREILPSIPAADLVFTDPPYGHNNNNNGDLIERREAALNRRTRAKPEARPIANDGDDAGELARWLFAESSRLLPPGCCCCCCCGGGGPDPQFARWALWLDAAMSFKQMVVWDKGPMGMGWHYRRSYETVLVGEKPGAACRWFDETNRIENIIRHIPKIIPSHTQHPTEKPVALAAHFIRLHSRAGDLITDPFMGGGGTGIAAVQAGRRFLGIEIEPRWFDIACRRIEAEARQGRLQIDPPRPRTPRAGLFDQPEAAE